MKQLTEFRLRRIISPMALVWVTVVVVVSLSGSIYVVEVRQNALIMHFRTMEAMLHQSQLDLAKGYLAVSMAGPPQAPFDRAEGLALLDQAASSLNRAWHAHSAFSRGTAVPTVDSGKQRTLLEIMQSVSRFRELLVRLPEGENARAVRTAAVAIAFFNLERQANGIQAEMQTELSAVLLDYDAVQIRIIWASVILLSIICIAVYAGDRSRKRAEHALAMSEERYRTLVEEASDGIFISDGEGRYTDVNPRACTMLGYSRDEILSMTVTDILPSTDVQVHPVRLDELRAGKVLLSERSLIRKDGSLLDVEISARMLPDGRMQGLTRDISARKQAEIALRASENKYRTIVSNIPGGLIHIFDRDFRYVFSTGEELERLGLSNEFLEGKSIHDILSPDMAALVDEQYQLVLRGETVRFEGAFGDDHFSITSGPLRDEAGEVVNILTLSVKITDRKRAEEALRKHAERLRSLHSIDQEILQAIETPEAIVQTALKHLRAMLQCSRASVGIFDVERKEVRVFVANVDGESIVETGTVLEEDMYGDLEILKTGKTEVVEDMSGVQSPPVVARLLRVEGIQSSINVPLLSAQGLYGALNIGWATVRRILPEEMEIVGEVARQVTIAFQQATLMQETKRYASELEQRVLVRTAELEDANRELEAFTYSVSHDLRAPLRAVDGFTRVLLEDYGSLLDTEGQRVCAVISDNARNMGRLIDDLLAFSRIGRAAMQSSLVDMAKLARGVYLEATTPEARERIDFTIGALPSAVGDPGLLRQVWVNLISNAIKFSSKRDRAAITISSLTTGEEVVYSIRDNGAGFDMKYADKLFGVFQRLHSAKEFEGTGVGLAIVQRIVHRHGGRVWAVGETGNGATFSFSIPTGQTPWKASTS